VTRGVALKTTGHENLKARCEAARVIVGTGEATRYANAIPRAGVPF
jgi:D-ribose pyranose/furanose isomerase RbsD